MSNFVAGFLILVLLGGWVGLADAAVITDSSGNAIAVNNLAISGSFYDVIFGVGSFTSVFGNGRSPDIVPEFSGDEATAVAAVVALAAELNAFSIPFVTDGLGAGDSIIVPTVYSVSSLAGPWTGTSAPLPWYASSRLTTTTDRSGAFGRTYAYAVFTKRKHAVTVPHTILLLIVALTVLACIRGTVYTIN